MRTTAAFGRHMGMALLEALLVATLLATLIAGAAAVLGTGNDTLAGGRYSVHVEDGVFASTTEAEVYGDRTDYWVKAKCFQGGSLVYYEVVTADVYGYATLTLGPTPSWTSGAADCTAEAGYHAKNLSWRKVATTSFQVSGQ